MLESEEIVRGRMVALSYDPNSGKPVEVSIEQKYAKSLELDLGDKMEIEVGGVPIFAEVVNIRRTLDQFSAQLFCSNATWCSR